MTMKKLKVAAKLLAALAAVGVIAFSSVAFAGPDRGGKGGGRTHESQVIQLKKLMLYVPTPELPTRAGTDVRPISNYSRALQKVAAECLEHDDLTSAKGILIAVGIKPNKTARVWCQSIEGNIPTEILRTLEAQLAKVEPPAVNGVMAFGMGLSLRGQNVDKFPMFPTAWLKPARKLNVMLSPPDDLFTFIWPD